MLQLIALKVLDTIMYKTQNVFFSGGQISNCTLIYDNAYNAVAEEKNLPGLLMLIDFKKTVNSAL